MLLLYLLLLLLPLVCTTIYPECYDDSSRVDWPKANYTCYAPQTCVAQGMLQVVTQLTDVKDDCAVFFKLHPFSNHKTQIIMESFVAKMTTIEVMKEDNTLILTCKKENDVTLALLGPDQKQINMISSEATNDKLKCEFDVDLLGLAKLGSSTDKISIEDVIVKTTQQGQQPIPSMKSTLSADLFCSPDVLINSRENFESDKFYAKAEYNAGRVICPNDKIFNAIEYRPDDSDKYEQIKQIICKDKKFVVTGIAGSLKEIPPDEDIDVRCAADAEYFCDYNPKASIIDNKHTVALNRTKPDIESISPKLGSIKCPDSHPLFVIGGWRDPIENAEIKCKNYYGKMKWTFKDYSPPIPREIILTENSPNVHCTNKYECHVKKKINASNLKGSFLNDDFLPSCQYPGNLTVSEGTTTKQNVISVECHGKSGQYYYHTSNFTSPITENTVFSCDYPAKEKQETMKDGMSMAITGTCAFIGSFVFAAIVHFILIVKNRRQMAAMNKQMETVDVENSDRYKVDKNQYQDEENKDDLFANDYLIKKREEAARDIQCDILPTEIPADNRDKSRLSPEVEAILGLRSGGNDKFVNLHPGFSSIMKKLRIYTSQAREELKRRNEANSQQKSKKSE